MAEEPAEIALEPGAELALAANLPASAIGPREAAVGLLLDGQLQGSVPARAEAGRWLVRAALPTHRAYAEADLASLADSTRLLAAPFDLRPAYGFAPASLALRRREAVGSFRLGRRLDPALEVSLLWQGRVLAAGIARRGEDGLYAFAARFLSLVRPGETARPLLHVGGCPVPGARLPVTAEALGYAGFLERAEGGQLSGWAADLRHPGRPVALELREEGRVLRVLPADLHREDLQRAGLGDGRCGFVTVLPLPRFGPGHEAALPVRIGLVVAGTGLELCNSPARVEPGPAPEGRFEALDRLAATGWARDAADPAQPVAVEVVCGGRVIARGRADLPRPGGPACGFRIGLAAAPEAIGLDLSVRIAGTVRALPGSPKPLLRSPAIGALLARPARVGPALLPRLRRRASWRSRQAPLSLLLAVGPADTGRLGALLTSVFGQWSETWELVAVDDSGDAGVHAALAEAKRDPRVRVLTGIERMGEAASRNAALRAARHGFVVPLGADTVLEPDAAWLLSATFARTGANLVYGDEALCADAPDAVLDLTARPGFSLDHHRSVPLVSGLVGLDAALAREAGGWADGPAPEADFLFRAIERADTIAQIPAVLQRRRGPAPACPAPVLQAHLDRTAPGARAVPADGAARVEFPADARGVLRVVSGAAPPDLGETVRAADSLVQTGAGLGAAANLAARRAPCAFLLLVDDSAGGFVCGSLARLRAIAARPEVGAVSPVLLGPDGRVAAAGLVLGFEGVAGPAFRFADPWAGDPGTGEGAGRARMPGRGGALVALRDVAALGPECLLIRRDLFVAAGGLDERLDGWSAAVDLCLRLRARGFSVLSDGQSLLRLRRPPRPPEAGAAARLAARWGREIAAGDPHYSPRLTLAAQDHALRDAPPPAIPRLYRRRPAA